MFLKVQNRHLQTVKIRTCLFFLQFVPTRFMLTHVLYKIIIQNRHHKMLINDKISVKLNIEFKKSEEKTKCTRRMWGKAWDSFIGSRRELLFIITGLNLFLWLFVFRLNSEYTKNICLHILYLYTTWKKSDYIIFQFVVGILIFSYT